ncbi:MAG: ABC transporter permease [Treponema sp.]|jgi:phospholipid/cholesterol/gamma-HCH transport system permease protein|nr:ABC transporter permease [Treponema sp.]
MKGTEDLLLQRVRNKLEGLGRYFVFLGTLGRTSLKGPLHISRCLTEIEHVGVNSVLIILLSGGAIGMIFALQMVALLQPFQAEIGTGAAVALALAREMAPVITALMLIAKNGSAMAAELGTMRVTEQIDALESMAISPVQYLVLPKVIACFLVFPFLTLLANLVGVFGAYIISIHLFDIDAASYMDYMFSFLSPRDVLVGLIKAGVMGLIVATLCCFYGLHAAPGAKGVGDSATNAVVASSAAILVADYMLTTIMLRFIYA